EYGGGGNEDPRTSELKANSSRCNQYIMVDGEIYSQSLAEVVMPEGVESNEVCGPNQEVPTVPAQPMQPTHVVDTECHLTDKENTSLDPAEEMRTEPGVEVKGERSAHSAQQ
ncbi:unnamed protein product, partial [Discosporangium mesarthrocarpum]